MSVIAFFCDCCSRFVGCYSFCFSLYQEAKDRLGDSSSQPEGDREKESETKRSPR